MCVNTRSLVHNQKESATDDSTEPKKNDDDSTEPKKDDGDEGKVVSAV